MAACRHQDGAPLLTWGNPPTAGSTERFPAMCPQPSFARATPGRERVQLAGARTGGDRARCGLLSATASVSVCGPGQRLRRKPANEDDEIVGVTDDMRAKASARPLSHQ